MYTFLAETSLAHVFRELNLYNEAVQKTIMPSVTINKQFSPSTAHVSDRKSSEIGWRPVRARQAIRILACNPNYPRHSTEFFKSRHL